MNKWKKNRTIVSFTCITWGKENFASKFNSFYNNWKAFPINNLSNSKYIHHSEVMTSFFRNLVASIEFLVQT